MVGTTHPRFAKGADYPYAFSPLPGAAAAF